MAKLKSKVVDMAKKSEAKKKRTLMGKGKGKGIKADKPLKKLGKSLKRIRKNPGGFAASVVDAASTVVPAASLSRAGVKIVGKTDLGRKILADIRKVLKRGSKKQANNLAKKNNYPTGLKKQADNLARKSKAEFQPALTPSQRLARKKAKEFTRKKRK